MHRGAFLANGTGTWERAIAQKAKRDARCGEGGRNRDEICKKKQVSALANQLLVADGMASGQDFSRSALLGIMRAKGLITPERRRIRKEANMNEGYFGEAESAHKERCRGLSTTGKQLGRISWCCRFDCRNGRFGRLLGVNGIQ